MTWIKRIEYASAYSNYMEQRDYEKKQFDIKKRKLHAKRYTYYTILLIQLLNKCNVSEAIEALYMACNGKPTIVRKRKSKDKQILINIPKTDFKICSEYVGNLYNGGNIKTDLISQWTLRNLGYNTHSNKHAR